MTVRFARHVRCSPMSPHFARRCGSDMTDEGRTAAAVVS
jgi:hypothetical protein